MPTSPRLLAADGQLVRRTAVATAAVFVAAYYALLLTDGQFNLLKPLPPYGQTFNSMAVHLLAGRFDVDPAAVHDEGFLRDGQVYAYWGIFCALLRMPLMVHSTSIDQDVTVLSCLVAVCLGATFKFWTLLVASRHSPSCVAHNHIVAVFAVWLLFSGAQIEFLRASIYQEVVFWANALAAVFVFAAVRGWVDRRFSTGNLTLMAMAAGLAINTRISTGIGLLAAFALLQTLLIVREIRDGRDTIWRRIARSAISPRVPPPQLCPLCVSFPVRDS